MNLSHRLKKIINMLELPTKVADIGTDHAYLPIYLAQNSDCPIVIASDCNRAPYEAALEHVQKAGLENEIELRLGTGLSILRPGEVETVIIAGMGGITIRDIIANSYEVAQELEQIILQPMTGAASLRKWLVDNRFKISTEKLVKRPNQDGFYQILSIKPGVMNIKDDFLLELGPKLIEERTRLLNDYLKYLEKKWQRIKEDIASDAPNHPKIDQITKQIEQLEEVKKWL